MRAVWKYPIALVDGPQTIEMPQGARVVAVEVQHGAIAMWAVVSLNNPRVLRSFVVHGTGHPIEHTGRWVGTTLMNGGQLVWHVFELPDALVVS